MYTYIMKSVDLHKIGKAMNPQERLKGFQTGNPYIELVKTIEGNYESYLHQKYKDKRVTGEWFKLTEDDIKYLCTTDLSTITNPYSRILEKEGMDKDQRYVKSVLYGLLSTTLIDKELFVALSQQNYYGIEVIYNGDLLENHPSKKDTVKLEIDDDKIVMSSNGKLPPSIKVNEQQLPIGNTTKRPKVRLYVDEETGEWKHEKIVYPDEK